MSNLSRDPYSLFTMESEVGRILESVSESQPFESVTLWYNHDLDVLTVLSIGSESEGKAINLEAIRELGEMNSDGLSGPCEPAIVLLCLPASSVILVVVSPDEAPQEWRTRVSAYAHTLRSEIPTQLSMPVRFRHVCSVYDEEMDELVNTAKDQIFECPVAGGIALQHRIADEQFRSHSVTATETEPNVSPVSWYSGTYVPHKVVRQPLHGLSDESRSELNRRISEITGSSPPHSTEHNGESIRNTAFGHHYSNTDGSSEGSVTSLHSESVQSSPSDRDDSNKNYRPTNVQAMAQLFDGFSQKVDSKQNQSSHQQRGNSESLNVHLMPHRPVPRRRSLRQKQMTLVHSPAQRRLNESQRKPIPKIQGNRKVGPKTFLPLSSSSSLSTVPDGSGVKTRAVTKASEPQVSSSQHVASFKPETSPAEIPSLTNILCDVADRKLDGIAIRMGRKPSVSGNPFTQIPMVTQGDVAVSLPPSNDPPSSLLSLLTHLSSSVIQDGLRTFFLLVRLPIESQQRDRVVLIFVLPDNLPVRLKVSATFVRQKLQEEIWKHFRQNPDLILTEAINEELVEML